MHPISEAELIEVERLITLVDIRYVKIRRKYADDVYIEWWDGATDFPSGAKRAVNTIRQLIDQARAGQLCAECGAVIVPYGTKAV